MVRRAFWWRVADRAATGLLIVLIAGLLAWWLWPARALPRPRHIAGHPKGFHRHADGRWYLECDRPVMTEDEAARPWVRPGAAKGEPAP